MFSLVGGCAIFSTYIGGCAISCATTLHTHTPDQQSLLVAILTQSLFSHFYILMDTETYLSLEKGSQPSLLDWQNQAPIATEGTLIKYFLQTCLPWSFAAVQTSWHLSTLWENIFETFWHGFCDGWTQYKNVIRLALQGSASWHSGFHTQRQTQTCAHKSRVQDQILYVRPENKTALFISRLLQIAHSGLCIHKVHASLSAGYLCCCPL